MISVTNANSVRTSKTSNSFSATANMQRKISGNKLETSKSQVIKNKTVK